MVADPDAATWPVTLDTLGALIDHDHVLTVGCERCGRDRRLDLAALAGQLGRDYRPGLWPDGPLARRLRCERCGGASYAILQAGSTARSSFTYGRHASG